MYGLGNNGGTPGGRLGGAFPAKGRERKSSAVKQRGEAVSLSPHTLLLVSSTQEST